MSKIWRKASILIFIILIVCVLFIAVSSATVNKYNGQSIVNDYKIYNYFYFYSKNI